MTCIGSTRPSNSRNRRSRTGSAVFNSLVPNGLLSVPPLFLLPFPTEETVAIEANETKVRQNPGDAACNKPKGDPPQSTDNSDHESYALPLCEIIGGDKTEDHSHPIRAFEFDELLQHRKKLAQRRKS